jgi:type III secretion protein V
MDRLNAFLSKLSQRQDLVFVLLFSMVVAMLVIPLPTILIDILLAINITLSIVILMVALYLKNVLDLSTFPAIILVSTIFRLALTVSTTRLILAQGDAGKIIAAFGNFVVGGNLVVGLVIFFIVAIVQFIVVTKGAERIAEVSARFTLDALPGKQMAIDADVRAGDTTKEEAKKRRFILEKESQLFGSMDGAMRFVKGDAIASLVIVFVNLFGGMLIGTLQGGMPFREAIKLYALLSVGDGLVAQIPSMRW